MLHQTENLGMFSFTDFQGCSIATVILLLEFMRRGNIANSLSIDTGFSCLRYMATENQHAKLVIQYVEELRAIANQVIEKCMQRSSDDQNNRIDSRGIDAYQTWIQTVLDGSSTPETSQENVLEAEANPATGIAQNDGFDLGVAENSFQSRFLSNGLGQVNAAGKSDISSLSPAFQFAAASTILPDDPSDTFLFGLTGLYALDFLVSDNLLHE
jgi:transcription elongation factor Elf1